MVYVIDIRGKPLIPTARQVFRDSMQSNRTIQIASYSVAATED